MRAEWKRRIRRARRGAGRINIWLPALLAFMLPLSTSAVSVLALLILLLWLFEGGFVQKCAEVFFHPLAVALLGFLLLLWLGLLWTQDFSAGLNVLREHWKIALLPIFMTAISYQHRSLYISSFLVGMSLAMLITFLAWFGLIQYADVTPSHLTPKTFHVVYNPLLAFAIYLVLHEALWQRKRNIIRGGLFCLAGLMTLNMFITEGRAGQAVFFVLIALLLFQVFRKKRLKAALAIGLLLPMLFVTGYLGSSVFKQRVDMVWEEMAGFKKNPNTSVGLRMQFVQNSFELIRNHPWVGVGTGDFQAAYAQVNQDRSPYAIATDNPHNQYILTTVMLGLPGLLALLLIFTVMFFQAGLIADEGKRIRVAFPLFFLVIMLSESYLKVYETAFFFSLFAAFLYKKKPDKRIQKLQEEQKRGKKCWLILSYRANIEGSACSQHIDDRLPFFREQGIEPVLLTSPVGEQSQEWIHYRTLSIAPSGIRFEIRHFLRKHLQKRWQFKTVETLLLLPIWPFYLFEKIIVNLESEWSWCILASLRGLLLCRQLQPEVIYSTGGSASAHLAALLIKRYSGIRWLAETQDPLVHDRDWRRSKLVLQLYKYIEKRICDQADAFIFLVRAAMEHYRQRVGGSCCAAVIYPGSVPSLFQQAYRKGDRCHFAHLGSLSGTRKR
ncbi:MAG: hypothetical protein D3923_06220, partial [Candidatus Electrothrix sp. AR3]|nr:hypothetical protein [Candidatus Electrothrix sp. AR3]